MPLIFQDLVVQVVANAPAVGILLYLLVRQERTFNQLWDRCLARIQELEDRETADPPRLG